MTIKQLHFKLGKEIKDGDGHHSVYLRVWNGDGCESVEIKKFIHCSDAVILEPKDKLILMKEYLVKIKGSFEEYYKQLKKMFHIN